MTFEKFTINGLKADIFNYAVIKTHLTFKELAFFSTYDEGFQREVDIDHCNHIEKFILTNQYKYFPDIIMSIRHQDINMTSKTIIKNEKLKINQLARNDLITVSFLNPEVFQYIRIIDGNHRLAAIKSIIQKDEYTHLLDNKVGVTFLIMQDSDNAFIREMALFYYLNTKAKPLLPKDLLSDFLDSRLDMEAKNIDWWLFVFKKSYEHFKDIFEEYFDDEKNLKEIVANACNYYANALSEEDNEQLIVILVQIKELINHYLSSDLIDIFLQNRKLNQFLSIVFYICRIKSDLKTCAWEIENFIRWMIEVAKLTNFENFEDLYQTYSETYIPKDFKIFVAMEFSETTDNIYEAINITINDVSKKLGISLICERIDKHITGTTYQIMDEILNKITHNGLLIADITNQNPNVYLEVGFAMGIARGKEIEDQVLLFVKDEGENTKVGFDLRSYKQNRYKDPEHLQEQLETELLTYYNKPIYRRNA